MADIYSSIGDEFDRTNILENLANISNELKEEQSKPTEEQDMEKTTQTDKQAIYGRIETINRLLQILVKINILKIDIKMLSEGVYTYQRITAHLSGKCQ